MWYGVKEFEKRGLRLRVRVFSKMHSFIYVFTYALTYAKHDKG